MDIKHGKQLYESPGACPTAHRSTFLSHFSGPVSCSSQLLNSFRLNDGAIFDGLICNADPHEMQSCDVVFTMMLFGCTRAICELKGIYNV